MTGQECGTGVARQLGLHHQNSSFQEQLEIERAKLGIKTGFEETDQERKM